MVVYCALDDTAQGEPDRWSLWQVTAASLAGLDVRNARPVAEGHLWALLNARLAGGVKDPTIVRVGNQVNLMAVGRDSHTGRAGTYRLTWDGAGWVPRGDRPIARALGVAAAEARYTGGLRLRDGRFVSLYDVAPTRKQNTRETGVMIVSAGPFAEVTFEDTLPPTVAAPGISARYGTLARYGGKIRYVGEVMLGDEFGGAHGPVEEVYSEEQFERIVLG